MVGFDLVPSKPDRPGNYRFTKGNLLEGLPFADDSFDFVHQRLMLTAIPPLRWPGCGPLLRVTRHGGFVELLEIRRSHGAERTGDEAALELRNRLGRPEGSTLLGKCSRYSNWLRDAGAISVERHHVAIPIGNWGGSIG